MDEKHIREIIREEIAAHEERLMRKPVEIQINDEMKATISELMKELGKVTPKSPLTL